MLAVGWALLALLFGLLAGFTTGVAIVHGIFRKKTKDGRAVELGGEVYIFVKKACA